MKKLLVACMWLFMSGSIWANTIRYEPVILVQDSLSSSNLPEVTGYVQKSKGVAVTLAITLGVFGVHRLYLGTAPKTPVVYTLTLGGGFGTLMVADIVAILASKDLSRYAPNDRIFMWAK